MVKSFHRGHPIIQVGGEWVFLKTKQLVSQNKNIVCATCGNENTIEGHDACLGNLPGVANACCGHGKTSEAYIQFQNGITIRGFKLDKN